MPAIRQYEVCSKVLESEAIGLFQSFYNRENKRGTDCTLTFFNIKTLIYLQFILSLAPEGKRRQKNKREGEDEKDQKKKEDVIIDGFTTTE